MFSAVIYTSNGSVSLRRAGGSEEWYLLTLMPRPAGLMCENGFKHCSYWTCTVTNCGAKRAKVFKKNLNKKQLSLFSYCSELQRRLNSLQRAVLYMRVERRISSPPSADLANSCVKRSCCSDFLPSESYRTIKKMKKKTPQSSFVRKLWVSDAVRPSSELPH